MDNKCVCCNVGYRIEIEADIPIDNITVRCLIFCERCMSEPNIFVDHTPYDVSQGKAHPRTLTPNFSRYLLIKATTDQPLVWKKFVK